MSKYKGNYGSSKETLAPPSTAASSSSVDESSTLLSTASTFENFVELLDSYGFDLPAMLLIFWCLVLFVIVCGVNLYLTLVKRQQRINAVANQSEGHDGARSEPTVTATSATSQLHSSPKYHSEDDEDSKGWIQRVIEWLYRADINTPAVITECIESWLASLNAKAKKLTVENGIHIEFVHLYRDKSSAIRFSNVKVDSELNDNILTTLKATCDRLVIQVRVAATSRDLSSGQSALYEIELNKFSALLKVVCKPDDSLFVARFLERPETKVHITNGPQSASEKTFSPDLIINGILNILSSTLVDLNFNYAANFPHFRSRSLSSSLDGTLENGNGSRTRSRRAIERKLFVTIVKAHNLTLNQAKEGHEVYCTIELNEPREKRKTASIREDASSPVWQDHFLFGLNEQSREILFEVFDGFQEKKTSSSRSTENNRDECLGFGTVNILELRLNPSEKLSIPLQSNGLHRGSLEIELLLMEHKLPASMCTDDTGELLNTTEKNQFQHSKVPAELASYYRDLSSTATHSSRRRQSSQSLSISSSGFNEHSTLGEEDLDTDICVNPIAHYECSEYDDDLLSSKASSFLASLESELISLGSVSFKRTRGPLLNETPMSSRAAFDSLSTSNSSLTSSSGTSPKEGKLKRFARLTKIASLGSLFSTHSSGSSSSGAHRLAKSPSNTSLSTSNGNLSRHRQSTLYAARETHIPPQQFSSPLAPQHHQVASLAMSLPVISPLLDVKRRSYPTDQPNATRNDEFDASLPPGILVTQPSLKANKAGSLRWLRSTSLKLGKSKKPIQLPPTVLYPRNAQPNFEPSQCQANGFCGSSQHPLVKPSLAQSNLDIAQKRSSLYSQLSFDSIDSRLSLVDDSTLDEDYLSSNRLVDSTTRQQPMPLPAPINLQTTSHNAPLYGRYSAKAKSDTHLYFTLDEASTEEALLQNSAFESDRERQYFFGDGDLPEDATCQCTSTPPATPLKRNSNRRTSLYAKFISAKRATTKSPNSASNGTVNSVKQRFKFRSSSKVPRLNGDQSQPRSVRDFEQPLNSPSHRPVPPMSPPSNHRTSEPSLQCDPYSPPPRVGKMSIISVSSANLSASPGEPAPAPLRLHPPPRRRSYKSATDMSFMQRTQSSPLPPLTANSANSTSSHLDHYTRSSLNTIKSDDNAHSSEGYGTDRGITPEVAHSSDALPPTRPESRASQPREPRSLIRTIRKRLSFSKRSKSVERQPNSFREPSVGSNDIRDERARSVPGSREPSAPRDMANGKKQESFLSLASNTSFFAENSTLVLECTVNGEKKHYIVPYSKANKRKYRRRKGTKLHVFNDHLFVAQHMASSQVCQVCTKTFPLRLGKQGYACRECGFLTHKQCHINADAFCSANGAARLNFEVDTSDTPKQVPSPVPEVRVIAPTESGGLANDTDNEIRS